MCSNDPKELEQGVWNAKKEHIGARIGTNDSKE